MPAQLGDDSTKTTKPKPKPKPNPILSGTTGNDFSDVSSSAQGGGYSGAPFTNTVDPNTGMQNVQAPGSPGAALNAAVDQSIAGDGPGSSGDGGTAPDGSSIPATDWADVFWGSLGLPPDLVAQINAIFTQYPDMTMAQAVAQNALQSSPWFAQTFPGYSTGVQNGLFTDPTGYRDYVNQLNQLSNAYQGQNVTTDQVLSNLQAGYNPTRVQEGYQAGEILAADQSSAAAAMFSPGELSQIAQEAAGIGSQNGQYLGQLFTYANQVSPILSQYGQSLDRGTVENYFTQGTSVANVGNILQGNAFAAANAPAINYAAGHFGDTGQLSQDQLNAYGQDQSGYATPLGEQIKAQVDQAVQRMNGIFKGQTGQAAGLSLGPQGLNAPGLLGQKQPGSQGANTLVSAA